MTALRFRLTNVLLGLVLLSLVTIIAMLASDVRGGSLDPQQPPAPTDGVRLPGTPIDGQYAITTPGHYCLTRDIIVAGAVIALTISTSDVSLDLGGFTVRGNDAVGSYGIHITSGRTGIHISNGTVRDFQFGLDAGIALYVHIDEVHAISNVRGIQLGARNVLTRCSATANTETGIYAPGSESVVRECSALWNSSDGIAVAGVNVLVERSYATSNLNEDIRTTASATVIRENTTGDIILLQNGSARVLDNVCLSGGIGIVNPAGNFVGPTDHANANC